MKLIKPKLLIFIVAYCAETTISKVFSRIPQTLDDDYEIEVLVIDDASHDKTFEKGLALSKSNIFPFKVRILCNPINQGYGGNQKIGYHYAIENGFDYVALVHGDGQYDPECLKYLLLPLRNNQAEAVFGSRMLNPGDALKGGMPLYKWIGNKILTWVQNLLLKTSLSEFHSGYRVYSVKALSKVPFDLNTNDFHFDTEIIIQFILSGFKIVEEAIPTYYGDEICRVNGIKYALNVVIAVIVARIQRLGLFYSPNFDCNKIYNNFYQSKFNYPSTHSEVLSRIKPHSKVLDLGCAGGYVGIMLKEKLHCEVTGVDYFDLAAGNDLDKFIRFDLNQGLPKSLDFKEYDYILMLDILEHLNKPEKFIQDLRHSLQDNPEIVLIASTGNIAFFIQRIMLLFGQFNYGKRGILDITHTRLFTSSSFKKLFLQNGYLCQQIVGIPAPFPLAIGLNLWSKLFLVINKIAIFISKGLFSYQILLSAKPLPTLENLLKKSIHNANEREKK